MPVTRPSKFVARLRNRTMIRLGAALLLAFASTLPVAPVQAQEGLQPGTGFATRFSGTVSQTASDGTVRTVIDPNGVTGAALDLARPGYAPDGRQWQHPPELFHATAAATGQVFGVTFDDAPAANIYVTATSAFGLHRNADNSGWMDAMWGEGGGPGTVYRLDARDNYRPSVFARITLDGRSNSGAALGNIAYDRWHRQFFVSDLETGMIHRLRLADGFDDGHYDHGGTGRTDFLDAQTGERLALPAIGFDPGSSARTVDCPSGDFARDPSCWNVADFRRRAWGLGVRRDGSTGEVRLYYAIWGAQALGNPDHALAGEHAHNSVWSVGLAPDGDFDTAAVRREFLLPDFFRSPEAIARAGFSHPVSDISFADYADQTVMLLAERGGLRNRGLDAENSFAFPHESRVLRYALRADGVWQPDGRYDVGYQDRQADGTPYLRAGSAGGVAFGMGYGADGSLNEMHPDAFVWMSGDGLCTPDAPCPGSDGPGSEGPGSEGEVHGLQGNALSLSTETEPAAAFQPYPVPGPATPPSGPDQAFMIDADLGAAGGDGNDATRIGDIAIYQSVPVVAEIPAEGPWYGPWPGPWPWPVPIPGGDLPPPPPPGEELPELGITKITPPLCDWERDCTFLVSVTNNGPGIYDGPLLVVDFAEEGTFGSASPGWTCEQTGVPGPVMCRHDPLTLAPGDATFLALTFLMPTPVPAPPPWDTELTNCAFVAWTGELTGAARVQAVEVALLLEGYDPGPVDGIADVDTQAAIDAYRLDHALPAGGIDDELYTALYPGSAGMDGDADATNDIACASYILPGEDGFPPPPPLETFDLALEKTLLSDVCVAGDTCDFRITISNQGGEAYHGPLVFGDIAGIEAIGPLPLGAIGPASPGLVCVPEGGGQRCELDGAPVFDLPFGATIEFDITIDVPAGAPPMTDLRNCGVIHWGAMAVAPDANPGNDFHCVDAPLPAEAIEPVDPDPVQIDLALTKQGPETCMRGVGCPHTITVTNNGPEDYVGSLWLLDQWDEGPIAGLEASPAAWQCDASYRGVTCVHAALTLAPDDTVEMSVVWPVPADQPLGIQTNCGTVYFPANFPIDSWETAINVERALDFAGYSPGPVNGVVDDETHDAVSAYRDAHGLTPGTAIDDELVVSLFPGSSGLPGDSDSSNNSACVDVEIVEAGPVDWGPAVDLEPGGGTECVRGETCVLDVTINNRGDRQFDGAAGLHGALDPAVSVVSVEGRSPGLICDVTGDGSYDCLGARLAIKPGDAAHMQVRIAVPAGFASDTITHTKDMVWPDAGVKDRNPDNDRHVSIIDIVDPAAPPPPPPPPPLPDLAVSKVANQGSCTAGDRCRFAVTVSNNGPGAFDGTIELSDVVSPATARLSDYGPRPWSCRGSRGDYSCRLAGISLAPGASRALQLTFTTSRNASGTLRNCAGLDWAGGARIARVQQALADAGFNPGPVDGVIGSRTRAAIGAYRKASGLPASSAIDAALLQALLGLTTEGDPEPGNDRACAEVRLIAPPAPQRVVPQPQPAEPSHPPAQQPERRIQPAQPRATPPAATPQPTQPPAAVRPTCPSGWKQVGAAQAAILAAQGRRVMPVTKSGRTILCVAPAQRVTPQVTPRVTPQQTPQQTPQSVAPRCDAGWTAVSRTRAKALVQQGYEIKQVRSSGKTILCARPRQ